MNKNEAPCELNDYTRDCSHYLIGCQDCRHNPDKAPDNPCNTCESHTNDEICGFRSDCDKVREWERWQTEQHRRWRTRGGDPKYWGTYQFPLTEEERKHQKW